MHLNPYVDFISGLNSSENQQLLLIVELFLLLWYINTPLVKVGWWSLTFVFGLQYSAGLLIIVKGQAFKLVILCGLCLGKNIHGEHRWPIILKYNRYVLPVQVPMLFIRRSIPK